MLSFSFWKTVFEAGRTPQGMQVLAQLAWFSSGRGDPSLGGFQENLGVSVASLYEQIPVIVRAQIGAADHLHPKLIQQSGPTAAIGLGDDQHRPTRPQNTVNLSQADGAIRPTVVSLNGCNEVKYIVWEWQAGHRGRLHFDQAGFDRSTIESP
jgi:hypothetical protein